MVNTGDQCDHGQFLTWIYLFISTTQSTFWFLIYQKSSNINWVVISFNYEDCSIALSMSMFNLQIISCSFTDWIWMKKFWRFSLQFIWSDHSLKNICQYNLKSEKLLKIPVKWFFQRAAAAGTRPWLIYLKSDAIIIPLPVTIKEMWLHKRAQAMLKADKMSPKSPTASDKTDQETLFSKLPADSAATSSPPKRDMIVEINGDQKTKIRTTDLSSNGGSNVVAPEQVNPSKSQDPECSKGRRLCCVIGFLYWMNISSGW